MNFFASWNSFELKLASKGKPFIESGEVPFSGLKACKKKIPQDIIKKLPMQCIWLIELIEDLIHSTPARQSPARLARISRSFKLCGMGILQLKAAKHALKILCKFDPSHDQRAIVASKQLNEPNHAMFNTKRTAPISAVRVLPTCRAAKKHPLKITTPAKVEL